MRKDRLSEDAAAAVRAPLTESVAGLVDTRDLLAGAWRTGPTAYTRTGQGAEVLYDACRRLVAGADTLARLVALLTERLGGTRPAVSAPEAPPAFPTLAERLPAIEFPVTRPDRLAATSARLRDAHDRVLLARRSLEGAFDPLLPRRRPRWLWDVMEQRWGELGVVRGIAEHMATVLSATSEAQVELRAAFERTLRGQSLRAVSAAEAQGWAQLAAAERELRKATRVEFVEITDAVEPGSRVVVRDQALWVVKH